MEGSCRVGCAVKILSARVAEIDSFGVNNGAVTRLGFVVYADSGVSIAHSRQEMEVSGVGKSCCSRNMSYDSTSIPNRKDHIRNVRTDDGCVGASGGYGVEGKAGVVVLLPKRLSYER